jgi:DNA mismatch repair protein MutL
MSKIVRLSESVINQIAAGEVVENPASIVKELLENSIDAGANHLEIRIRGGGQISIEVEDNGCGMNREDATLSFERHATSKIRTASDLSTLKTMGFRGEAVAAIASVSCMEIKTSDGIEGTWIKTKGGEIENIVPCARNQGTTVVVKSLFFNVPARKKFQKSMASNTAQVTRIVETIAIANPGIAITYSIQDNRVLHLPIQSKKERIEAVFGNFEHEASNHDCWGVFRSPQQAKATRRDQMVFINHRPIFSPLISKAVKAGYGTRIDENMHPPFVLFLEMDPAIVDVNVHPQKKEVRFANESEVFAKVEKTVREMFVEKTTFSAPIFFEETSFMLAEPRPFFEPVFQQTLHLEIPIRPIHILGKYFLMENGSLILVDLQGARFRIFFEEIREGSPQKQNLLFPIEAIASDPEILESLQKLGFDCRWIGEKKIIVEAIPSSMEASEFQTFFDTWKNGRKLDAACRLNPAKKFTIDEAIHIWNRLQKCEDRLYDPNGKKIWGKIEERDLEWILRESSACKKD